MPLIINRHGGAAIPSRRTPRMPPPPSNDGQVDEKPQPNLSYRRSDHEASMEDVMEVKQLLMKAGKLPIELADIIVHHAEYWACSVAIVDYTSLDARAWKIKGGSPAENQFLLRTMPLGLMGWSPSDDDAWRKEATPGTLQAEVPLETLQKYCEERDLSLVHPCMKIVFDITSNDQGWGGEYENQGTYRGSWTWFDAGLERFDAKAGDGSTDLYQASLRPVWPLVVPKAGEDDSMAYHHELGPAPDHRIQANKLAVAHQQFHHVEWRWNDDMNPDELEEKGRGGATGNGEFVRNLKLGDIVTIWGRARFASWVNNVERVEIKVYWAA